MSAATDNSKSNYSVDTRAAGSDEATVAGANAAATQSGISLGGFLTTNKLNSTEVFGNVASNSLYGSTNTGTINYGMTPADVTKLLADTTGGIADLVKKQSDVAQQNVADVVTGLQDLALSKQTGGESARDNTILWVVGLGLAGLLGLFYFLRGGRG